jgi:hypothetical protein
VEKKEVKIEEERGLCESELEEVMGKLSKVESRE